MKFTPASFRAWEHKKITLLGMSGVGKTYISSLLRRHDWFHFSGDYRIGTRYLDEPILDLIKQQAMQVPFLRELLRRDWIDIRNNIKIQDLGPVLSFVGKLGNPDYAGLALPVFSQRQALYREAEIAAMKDVPAFIRKAREIYGYDHFVNDVGGSLCELEEDAVIALLAEHTLILYIQVTSKDEEDTLIRRAQSDPSRSTTAPLSWQKTCPSIWRKRVWNSSPRWNPTTSPAGSSRACSTLACRVTKPSPAPTATRSPHRKSRR